MQVLYNLIYILFEMRTYHVSIIVSVTFKRLLDFEKRIMNCNYKKRFMRHSFASRDISLSDPILSILSKLFASDFRPSSTQIMAKYFVDIKRGRPDLSLRQVVQSFQICLSKICNTVLTYCRFHGRDLFLIPKTISRIVLGWKVVMSQRAKKPPCFLLSFFIFFSC